MKRSGLEMGGQATQVLTGGEVEIDFSISICKMGSMKYIKQGFASEERSIEGYLYSNKEIKCWKKGIRN